MDFGQLIRSLHPKVKSRNYQSNLVYILMISSVFLALQVMLGLPVVEGTNPASCFPRAVIGSEATCYSRLWSEVMIDLHSALISLTI